MPAPVSELVEADLLTDIDFLYHVHVSSSDCSGITGGKARSRLEEAGYTWDDNGTLLFPEGT